MSQVWLISGSPGCGKTNWILNTFKNHSGNCGYIRLGGYSEINLEQAINSKIDFAFLKDQIPNLLDLSISNSISEKDKEKILIIIEFPQFFIPKSQGINGVDLRIINELEKYNLQPNRYLHFGRDPELSIKDTLDFRAIESISLDLKKHIWDPASLNTFWFELVNGAYGDVYRAKALMNLPDGRYILFNWIVSQQGSQYQTLNQVAPLNGRPERCSEIVIQGKNLNFESIKSTIHNCLLNDAVLDHHQTSLKNSQLQTARR